MTVIEGVYVFFNIVSNCRCIKVFKLLIYLGAGAYIVILLRALCACNLLLLRLPSCFIAAAIHRVSIEFPFKLLRDFKGGRVGVNN
jgi:hypothetical protein